MGAFSDEMDRIIDIEKQEAYEQGIIYGARKVLKLLNIDANISEDIMHYVLHDESMEKKHSNGKSITETMNESRKRFEAKFGRLLTEDEAISLTSNIKKSFGHCNEADRGLALKEINVLMRELEKKVIVTNHCWINFHFDNLEYDDTYFAGDFYPDDNNGQYHCSFRYDRIKKTYEIFNNEVSEEEILPLPIGYLEWKLEIEGKLDKTVWKISM